MAEGLPTAELATELAEAALGRHPVAASRFATGSQHFVFEVRFADRPAVVMRISRPSDRQLSKGASDLSRQLRPLGVPLPSVLAEDLEAPFPWMMLERLSGTDLGHVIGTLSAHQLDAVAAQIVRAQAIVGTTTSAGRYGYAARPGDAPHALWSDVLAASLDRSRRRIAAIGLYDLGPVTAAEALLERLRAEADDQPATPFLHDTTTKNVIVAPGGDFSGIVDVDDLCFGDPRAPLALTVAAIAAFGSPSPYPEFWMRHAGHRDDRLFRFYVALYLLDFMSEQGQVFNGNQQASVPETRQRLERLYVTALERVRAA